MKKQFSWVALVSAAVVLASGLFVTGALAKGKISKTEYGSIEVGKAVCFDAHAECEDNTETGSIALHVTIKNANGSIVAQGSGVGFGNYQNLQVWVPGPLVEASDTLTAEVILTQDSGEGTDTKAKVATPAK